MANQYPTPAVIRNILWDSAWTGRNKGMRRRESVSAIRVAAPALLICVLLLAPFYDKAFTIDDTLFLHGAMQVLVNPMRPGAYDVVWDEDLRIRVSAGSMITGPLAAYLL